MASSEINDLRVHLVSGWGLSANVAKVVETSFLHISVPAAFSLIFGFKLGLQVFNCIDQLVQSVIECFDWNFRVLGLVLLPPPWRRIDLHDTGCGCIRFTC